MLSVSVYTAWAHLTGLTCKLDHNYNTTAAYRLVAILANVVISQPKIKLLFCTLPGLVLVC